MKASLYSGQSALQSSCQYWPIPTMSKLFFMEDQSVGFGFHM